jgi:ABC-2 type transport system permease protein
MTGPQKGQAVKVVHDIWLVMQHELHLIMRSTPALALSMVQPIAYLVFFTPFLKTVMLHSGITSYGDAYQEYVPGLFTAMGLFGGLFAGFGFLAMLRQGVIDRYRVTPITRTGLVLGRALTHVTVIVFTSVVIVLGAVVLGLRVQIGDLLLAYVLMAMMVLLSVSVSYNVALLVPSENSLSTMVNTIAQPVSLLAGILIPLSLAPLWIRDVALGNPFAWAANAMRALFTGHPGYPVVWEGAVIVGTLAAVSIALTTRLFNHEVS